MSVTHHDNIERYAPPATTIQTISILVFTEFSLPVEDNQAIFEGDVLGSVGVSADHSVLESNVPCPVYGVKGLLGARSEGECSETYSYTEAHNDTRYEDFLSGLHEWGRRDLNP